MAKSKIESDHGLNVRMFLTGLALVVLRDQPAFAKVQSAKVLIRWPHSHHPSTGGVELAYFGNGAPQFRTHILYGVALVANELRVIHIQLDFASGGPAAHLGTGPAAPGDHQVFAQRLHVLLLVDAEPPAQPHQQDDRRDAPHNAEHGEESPHLVGPECGQSLAQDFKKSHRNPAGSQVSGLSYCSTT